MQMRLEPQEVDRLQVAGYLGSKQLIYDFLAPPFWSYFPFGHGMSYTTFQHSDLQASGCEADSPRDDHFAYCHQQWAICRCRSCPGICRRLPQHRFDSSAGTPGIPEGKSATGEFARHSFEVSREELGHYSSELQQWTYDGGPCTTVEVDPYLAISVSPLLSISLPTGCHVPWLIERRGGIRGRMGDLLKDETGKASVLAFPLRALVEFPGFPVSLDDIEQLVASN